MCDRARPRPGTGTGTGTWRPASGRDRHKDEADLLTPDALNLQRSIANLQRSAKDENVYINELDERNKHLKIQVDSAYETYKVKKQRKEELWKQTDDEKLKIEILRNFIESEKKKIQSEKNKIDILKQNVLVEKQEVIDFVRTHKAQMMEVSKQFQDLRHLHQPHILRSEIEILKASNADIKKLVAKKNKQLAELRTQYTEHSTKDDDDFKYLKTVLDDKQAFKKRINKEIETHQNMVKMNCELMNDIKHLKNKV